MKIIVYDSLQNPQTYFSTEKFFKNEIRTINSKDRILFYPEFRLPTIKERIKILNYSDSIDSVYFTGCNSRYCQECKKEYPKIRSNFGLCDEFNFVIEPTIHVYENYSAKKGKSIYHLRGNVSEWLFEQNISAGGGWIDQKQKIIEKDTFYITTPNAWTGFRNVISWKKWETKN